VPRIPGPAGVEAAAVLAVSGVGARVARLPELWRAIRSLPVGGSGEPAERVGARVERVGSRLGRVWPAPLGAVDACFVQALASAALLRWHGHAPELVIGTSTRPFAAHAWVEVRGRVVTGGAEASRFREIWRGVT
jgi:hypothetical protein